MRSKTIFMPALSVTVIGLLIAGCTAPSSPTEGKTTAGAPSTSSGSTGPIALNILDVGGAQRVTERIVDNFIAEHPDVISSVTWETGGAPDIVGTIKPQVDSGQLSIDIVLTGSDGLAAGVSQDLWLPIATDHADQLSNQSGYLDSARKQQDLSGGFGVLYSYTPNGPLVWYNSANVTGDDIPTSPQDVLDWAKAHPGEFGYARPANSGPGRTWLQGLPYALGDTDPSDPVDGWDKTWAYLKELNEYVGTYPTGTGQVVSNIADGSWSMTPISLGWDIESRSDGRIPDGIEIATFDDFTWVGDGFYFAIPRGVSADRVEKIIELVEYSLAPENNAHAFDFGYIYPGPAIKGATLDLASEETQALISEFARPELDALIASVPVETQLNSENLVTAFDIWDREIGSGKY